MFPTSSEISNGFSEILNFKQIAPKQFQILDRKKENGMRYRNDLNGYCFSIDH